MKALMGAFTGREYLNIPLAVFSFHTVPVQHVHVQSLRRALIQGAASALNLLLWLADLQVEQGSAPPGTEATSF